MRKSRRQYHGCKTLGIAILHCFFIGNELMDQSVMKAVNSVAALRPLPAGRKKPVDIGIVFEIAP